MNKWRHSMNQIRPSLHGAIGSGTVVLQYLGGMLQPLHRDRAELLRCQQRTKRILIAKHVLVALGNWLGLFHQIRFSVYDSLPRIKKPLVMPGHAYHCGIEWSG